MAWLTENIGSIIILAAVSAVAALIVVGIIKRRKKGKTSCSCGECNGNCGCCPMANNRKTEEK